MREKTRSKEEKENPNHCCHHCGKTKASNVSRTRTPDTSWCRQSCAITLRRPCTGAEKSARVTRPSEDDHHILSLPPRRRAHIMGVDTLNSEQLWQVQAGNFFFPVCVHTLRPPPGPSSSPAPARTTSIPRKGESSGQDVRNDLPDQSRQSGVVQ